MNVPGIRTLGRLWLSLPVRFTSLSLLIALVLFSVGTEGQTLGLAGIQQSVFSSYDYLGVIQPLSGSRLGSGVYLQAFASYLRYRYTGSLDNSSTLVRARVPGLLVGAGYAFTVDKLQLNFSGGLEYQYFSLIPALPSGGPYRSTVSFVPQVQFHLPLPGHTYLSGIASYVIDQHAYWARLRFALPLFHRIFVGPEFIPSGGNTYRIRQYGGFLDIGLPEGWAISADGGLQHQNGLPNVGYAALSISKVF
ncbi:cellulose biosynthesis protein BcsS [Acidithiobacillus caldus]